MPDEDSIFPGPRARFGPVPSSWCSHNEWIRDNMGATRELMAGEGCASLHRVPAGHDLVNRMICFGNADSVDVVYVYCPAVDENGLTLSPRSRDVFLDPVRVGGKGHRVAR